MDIRQRLREAPNFHEMVPLDLTLVSADWETADYTITADGEFTTVDVNIDFEPMYAVLNKHNRLNQSRMDHEFVVRPGENFSSLVPYVDFRLWDDVVVSVAQHPSFLKLFRTLIYQKNILQYVE